MSYSVWCLLLSILFLLSRGWRGRLASVAHPPNLEMRHHRGLPPPEQAPHHTQLAVIPSMMPNHHEQDTNQLSFTRIAHHDVVLH